MHTFIEYSMLFSIMLLLNIYKPWKIDRSKRHFGKFGNMLFLSSLWLIQYFFFIYDRIYLSIFSFVVGILSANLQVIGLTGNIFMILFYKFINDQSITNTIFKFNHVR